MKEDYKTVCDHCYRGTWYEDEQPCRRTITPACKECGSREHSEPIPCPGTLRIIDNSQLDPRFARYYKSGERVKIEYADGEVTRCYIGKSTGWRPIYLEILKSNSSGGSSLYTDNIVSITGLNKYMYR